MFRVVFQPLSGAHIATCRERGWTGNAIQPRSRQVAVTVSMMPEAVDLVLRAPDDW